MITERLLSRLSKVPGARTLWGRYPVGSVDTRVRYGIFDRPHYAFGVHAAAQMATQLGIDSISVVEFGVAGGRGLVALERIARIMGDRFRLRINVVGFDSGKGMPPAVDYRDQPYVWDQGFFVMDIPKLKASLSPETELLLGDVHETISLWKPKAPIGFIAFDLDYYSSTRAAFAIFDNPSTDSRLPRTYCYFDDIFWPERACHNEYTGELCAIRDFNLEHKDRKICPIHMFSHSRPYREPWNDQIYVCHDFLHPLYCKNVNPSGDSHTQLPL